MLGSEAEFELARDPMLVKRLLLAATGYRVCAAFDDLESIDVKYLLGSFAGFVVRSDLSACSFAADTTS